MIGDRLIVKDSHWKKANSFVNKIEKNSLILIGGGSGVGKTEVADCLQHLLYEKGLTSMVLSLDDFYKIKPCDRNKHRKENGIDSVGVSEIDWRELRRVVEDFEDGKMVKFQRVHKYASVTEYDQIDSSKVDVIIFEGLYANYLQKFFNNKLLSVFLDGNPSQTYDFRLERKKENTKDEFRTKVVQKEFNVVCQLKRYAEIIIPF